jgi:nucleotide-binding universal stress UspA family protein
MATVLAALDNSLAVNPVLVMARALARVLGARVEAIHVLSEGTEAAEDAAGAAGVPLRLSSGPVAERLVQAGHAPGVAAMVIGARGTAGTGRPLGSTALAVVASMRKPVVVVAPSAEVAPRIRRVLMPLDGETSNALRPRSVIEPIPDADIEVIAVELDGRAQTEPEAAREVVRRFAPWGIGEVRVDRREGAKEDVVQTVAEESHSDLIVLGWTQQLSDARTPVVRAVLERSKIPVMLVPVHVQSKVGEEAPA